MIEIHAALLTAVQLAVVEEAVTEKVPVEATAATLAELVLNAKGVAAWLTLSTTGAFWPVPERLIEPDLGVVAAFAATA